MRIRRSCPGRPLRGCRVGDVQRAVVHVLVVVGRRTGVVRVRVLRVQCIEHAALDIRERPFKPTLAVALGRREHLVRRRGRILSVVMRLHLRKCGKTWRKVNSRWRRGRGGHGRVARAVVGDKDAHADLELALQLADALTKARNH